MKIGSIEEGEREKRSTTHTQNLNQSRKQLNPIQGASVHTINGWITNAMKHGREKREEEEEEDEDENDKTKSNKRKSLWKERIQSVWGWLGRRILVLVLYAIKLMLLLHSTRTHTHSDGHIIMSVCKINSFFFYCNVTSSYIDFKGHTLCMAPIERYGNELVRTPAHSLPFLLSIHCHSAGAPIV